MKLLKIFGILGMVLALSACSSIKNTYYQFVPNRDVAYLEAKASPPLNLPEGIELAENFQSPYIIPAGPLPGEDETPPNLVPPGGKAVWDVAQSEAEENDDE